LDFHTSASLHSSLQKDDVSGTSNAPVLEGVHFWWVGVQELSDVYLPFKNKCDLAAATAKEQADLAASSSEVDAAPSPIQSPVQAKQAALAGLFTKAGGFLGQNAGNYFHCFDEACPKHLEPYFLSKGGSNKHPWAHAKKYTNRAQCDASKQHTRGPMALPLAASTVIS
jgi:hypothetical protein